MPIRFPEAVVGNLSVARHFGHESRRTGPGVTEPPWSSQASASSADPVHTPSEPVILFRSPAAFKPGFCLENLHLRNPRHYRRTRANRHSS